MINEGCSSVVALALQRSSGLHLSLGDCPQSACFTLVGRTYGQFVGMDGKLKLQSGKVILSYIYTKLKLDKSDSL